MNTIKIGDKSLTVSRPADLDAQLIAGTGCSSREIDTLLSASPHHAAKALRPFLGSDAPSTLVLARAIGAGDISKADIKTIYDAHSDTKDAAPPKTGDDKVAETVGGKK